MDILPFVGLLIIIFVAFLLVRALFFNPYEEDTVPPLNEEIDRERAVESLARMIQCRTVSYNDTRLEDENEFANFKELLKERYPLVHQNCELSHIDRTGLLYRWPGKKSENPTVLMSHYDVVPAAEEEWEHPPFAGIIKEGHLWGRGTLDTKATLCGIMEAAEKLISEGFVPEQDIFFSFAGDEETNGTGTPAIVEHLEGRGIKPALVIDEGGAVVEGVVPGVKEKCALVGTGEKGKVHIRLSVKSQGGHGSIPPPVSPVGILAKAVSKIENKPFKFHLTRPAQEMFDTLGRHTGLGLKLVFANMKIFIPLLNLASRKLGGEFNALMRTTTAFTKMEGSEAINVFPPVAKVEADVRMIEGQTKDSLIRGLKQKIGDNRVKVEAVDTIEVQPSSTTGNESWKRMVQGIKQVWPEALVSPYLMIACTDSRHYARISDCVYRFSAMELTTEERQMIHGNNERIPLDKIETAVKFYVGMIRNS